MKLSATGRVLCEGSYIDTIIGLTNPSINLILVHAYYYCSFVVALGFCRFKRFRQQVLLLSRVGQQ